MPAASTRPTSALISPWSALTAQWVGRLLRRFFLAGGLGVGGPGGGAGVAAAARRCGGTRGSPALRGSSMKNKYGKFEKMKTGFSQSEPDQRNPSARGAANQASTARLIA